MAQIKIGIIGFGTVGTGTVEALFVNKALISDRLGSEIVIRKIADLDIRTERGIHLDKNLLTTDAKEVLADPEIDIVVELIGGIEPARTFILEALKNGKHVVTANKALMAEKGVELFRAAEQHKVHLAFEASVGGGIPVIHTMREGLAANRIRHIMGILNGTSNYILTEMTQKGIPYEQAVKEAQALGYAEDPPTLDVNGTDAAHKLTILITMAYGRPVSFDAIHREGIEYLTPEDIQFAEEFGFRLKLLAIARDRGDQGVEARVHLTMIPRDHILANVTGPFNAIYVDGDFVGPNLYYGQGAGKKPTASAVVSDIMDISRRIMQPEANFLAPLGRDFSQKKELVIQKMDDLEMIYYIRFYAMDQPGVLAVIAGILAKYKISIASLIQKGREVNGAVPIVMLTHEAREKNMQKALLEINQSKEVSPGKTVLIRVETGKL